MAMGTSGLGSRRSRGRLGQRVGVAIGAAALLLSTFAPVAGAAPVKGFGQHGPTIHKQLGARMHIDSARAAAAAARPRSATTAPRMPVLRGSYGQQPSASRLTSPSTRSTLTPAPAIVVPDVARLTGFAGLAEVEAGGWTPADPWVAVNGSWVVQAVNSMVRVSTRAGTPVLSIPNETLFGLDPGQFAADPRIIWDAVHGRWVGEVSSVNGTVDDNWLTIAVSDGSDPTLGWTVLPINYGTLIADYPAIASSSDKIVVTDNLFNNVGSFLAADFNTFTWSSILAGGAVTYNFCDDNSWIHPRAAQVLSPSNDVHLVMESTSNSHQVYWRVTSAGACPSFVDGTDLSTSLGLDPLELPPAPRQTGTDTIDRAVDERYTDAVWQSGHLWWVSTFPLTYDGFVTFNDQVVVWGVTTATTGSPTSAVIVPERAPDTIDAYMGGIGLSRNGTPILVYSQSSDSTPISLYADRIVGGLLGAPLLLDTSDGAISGERWGDYAGVAMDPVGTGTVWASHMLAAGDGTWRTDVVRLIVDSDIPTTPGAMLVTTVSPTNLAVQPKYKVSWGASTDANSGAVTYVFQQNVDGNGFGATSALTATSTTRALFYGHTYQFRVAAVDALGKASAWRTGAIVQPFLYQSPTSKSGTWHTSSSSAYSGGSTWYASAAGASATFTTSGVRSIGFVTTKASSRGSFRVYIDGALKATISAHTTATTYRQLVYQFTWSSPGTHTIKIVVLGTAGHPRVDVDAFLVLK
jgi:hypothetical protein